MKKLLCEVIVLLSLTVAFAAGKKDVGAMDEAVNTQIIASTPWTAAFAELAGVDGVQSVAPASLRHPPEYEVTVSDIERISGAHIFIYAGYERMMKTLADATGSAALVKIATDNSVKTVETQTAVIAAAAHTQKQNVVRVAAYKEVLAKGALAVEQKGLKTKRVLCHKMQLPLAKELGLSVAGTFGPEQPTAAQILDAKEQKYDIIIDNVHNPVASALKEVAPNAKLVIWRNFPDEVGKDALIHVVQNNISSLLN